MTQNDRTLISLPTTKARRAQLANMLPIVRPQLSVLIDHAPSYVVAAVDALMAAFDQWTKDEATLAKPN